MNKNQTNQTLYITIAVLLTNGILGGLVFRTQHFVMNLPNPLKFLMLTTATFFLALLAVYTATKTMTKQEIPIGKIGLGAAAATLLVILTSSIGPYLVPASQMSIKTGTTTLINLTPILITIATATPLYIYLKMRK